MTEFKLSKEVMEMVRAADDPEYAAIKNYRDNYDKIFNKEDPLLDELKNEMMDRIACRTFNELFFTNYTVEEYKNLGGDFKNNMYKNNTIAIK